MDFTKNRERFYGGRSEFMRIVRVNRKKLTLDDVKNIENDTGKGCMEGVARFETYLQLNGLEMLIRKAP